MLAVLLGMTSAAGFGAVLSVDSAPTVDGRLDEAFWTKATWESGFQRFRATPKTREVPAQTEFAIAADAENLYVGVKAHHRDMKAMLEHGNTDGIWNSEAVEFYFVPDGGTFEYYQFLMTFFGEHQAMFYSEGGNIRPDPYKPVWEMKTCETDYGWSLEARIPLSAFYMTRTAAWKDAWRINVCRTYREPGAGCFNCWADAKGYADVKNFRTISGFPIRRTAEDIWVSGVAAEVTGPKDGQFAGTLKMNVYAAEGGEFTLRTSFAEDQKITLRTGDTSLTFPALFPKNGRLPMSVALVRKATGVACERVYPVIVDYQAIRLKLTTPAYRGNFYPGQNSDRVAGRATVAVPGEVRVTLEGPGFGRKESVLPAGGGDFSFDTTGFAVGDATLTVAAGGASFVRKVRKLAPLGEGRHVSWIENGNLVVDGKPVFRRNMYAEYYMGGETFKRKYDADDLHQTRWLKSFGSLEPDRLIRGIERKEACKDVKPSAELFAKIDERIEKALKGDGCFYYISDEPECRQVSPVYLKHIYDYICEKDPYHVVVSCSRAGERYIDCADWFETHPYINAHLDEDGRRVYSRDFNSIGSFVDAFHPERHPDKCIGGTPTCFSYSGGDYPTFREYLLNVWCELVRGARTMYPYAYHDLGDRAALYEGTRYIFSSCEALEDLLLRGARQTLAQTPEYECCRWTMPDGEQLFAALNFTGKPLRVTVKGLQGSFREFRGERVLMATADSRQATNGIAVELAPHESFVATTKPHDAGLPTFAATQAKIDALDAERRGRDNQLLGRQLDMSVKTSTKSNGLRKMFDGTRDVIAWYDSWGKNKFYEMTFEKIKPTFSEIVVYGLNLDGMRAKVCTGDACRELKPTKVEKGECSLRYVFDRVTAAESLRLEFPKNHLELYEIELPAEKK